VECLKEDHVAADFANFLAPLIDPSKLDTLKGKRAATPRLRKACYWLQMAHISGFDAGGEEVGCSVLFYNFDGYGINQLEDVLDLSTGVRNVDKS
jgi:hypothetical protein